MDNFLNYKKVKMFGDEIVTLDKTMIVILDKLDNTKELGKNILKDIGIEDYSLISYCDTVKSLEEALRFKKQLYSYSINL